VNNNNNNNNNKIGKATFSKAIYAAAVIIRKRKANAGLFSLIRVQKTVILQFLATVLGV